MAEVWHRSCVCGGFYSGSTWRSFNNTLRLPVVPFSICIQTRRNRIYTTSLNFNKIPFSDFYSYCIFGTLVDENENAIFSFNAPWHSTIRNGQFPYFEHNVFSFILLQRNTRSGGALPMRATSSSEAQHEKAMILLFLLLSRCCWAMHAWGAGREEKEKHKRNSRTRKKPRRHTIRYVERNGGFYNRK